MGASPEPSPLNTKESFRWGASPGPPLLNLDPEPFLGALDSARESSESEDLPDVSLDLPLGLEVDTALLAAALAALISAFCVAFWTRSH